MIMKILSLLKYPNFFRTKDIEKTAGPFTYRLKLVYQNWLYCYLPQESLAT